MVAGWSFSTVVLQVVDTARLGGPRMRGAVHRRTTGRALRGGMTAASETAHYSITTSTQGKGSLGLGRQQPRHRHRRRRRRRRRRAHPRADAGATVEHRRHHRATHPLPPRLPGLGSLRVVSARRRSFGGREARPAATYRSGERSLAWAPSTRMAVSAHAAVSANTKGGQASCHVPVGRALVGLGTVHADGGERPRRRQREHKVAARRRRRHRQPRGHPQRRTRQRRLRAHPI
jgi:hypothetical protein